MRTNVSYPQQVEAKLVVRLANGTEWEATDEDVEAFGFAERFTAMNRFNQWLNDCLQDTSYEGADLTDTPMNVFRYAAECVLMGYDHMPTEDGQVEQVRDLIRGWTTRNVTAARTS
jgi:hypothetical protein